MRWLLLLWAIMSEVVATSALKASDGFTRPVPGVVAVIGYVVSLFLLSLTLKEMPVSVVYALWSAIGTAFVAMIGVALFGESMTAVKVLGLVLVVAGTIALNLGGATK